jgi:hypothetical protein
MFGAAPAPRALQGAAPAPAPSPARQARTIRSAWVTLGVTVTLTSAFFAVYAVADAPLFMVCSYLLAVSCLCFVLVHQPGETLLPAKVASLLYAASFSYAPLWLADRGVFQLPYFGLDFRPLLGLTSFITLAGYFAFLAGYFLVLRLFGRRPPAGLRQRAPGVNLGRQPFALLWAAVMGLIGAFCYVKVVVGSGGLAHLLVYSGGRADITAGVYGGWFWGAHLLFVAYGLFAVAAMRKHRWLCLLLALALAAVFVPLQGRDIVVGPLFCWLLFAHVLHKPLRWRTVVLGCIAIVLVAALLAAFRNGGNRLAAQDVGAFLGAFYDSAEKHLTDVVSANVDQLDTAMIGVRYVELNGHTIGPTVLLSWLAPLNRQFFGGAVPSIYSGIFMDLLVNPQHRGWNTALSPSLPGELYIGLGWQGVALGMLVYGAVFALLTVWVQRGVLLRPLLFAAYPFVVYMLAKMIVDGTTHAFRPMIVFFAALACALLAPVGKRDLRVAVPA